MIFLLAVVMEVLLPLMIMLMAEMRLLHIHLFAQAVENLDFLHHRAPRAMKVGL